MEDLWHALPSMLFCDMTFACLLYTEGGVLGVWMNLILVTLKSFCHPAQQASVARARFAVELPESPQHRVSGMPSHGVLW